MNQRIASKLLSGNDDWHSYDRKVYELSAGADLEVITDQGQRFMRIRDERSAAVYVELKKSGDDGFERVDFRSNITWYSEDCLLSAKYILSIVGADMMLRTLPYSYVYLNNKPVDWDSVCAEILLAMSWRRDKSSCIFVTLRSTSGIMHHRFKRSLILVRRLADVDENEWEITVIGMDQDYMLGMDPTYIAKTYDSLVTMRYRPDYEFAPQRPMFPSRITQHALDMLTQTVSCKVNVTMVCTPSGVVKLDLDYTWAHRARMDVDR